ncbi:protein of unknown function [Taphrina deformans PYCC 5710]|uniref:Uncharacterized protein n=1 Tax=Taphrina deformans (strain PYCC 5710 / ATCC 11124 / CBS 356.35 / IMI 108563 / JCM 9778 / NBRC 8474) TaxID=1097556 RepID=R4XC82_TAPDE|nr:protein of unknown function [Taphrina deformans PYCC 5710]|eukprot:CCG83431.1 protein of unknown function [Taphrina deformans PYCC 5710]
MIADIYSLKEHGQTSDLETVASTQIPGGLDAAIRLLQSQLAQHQQMNDRHAPNIPLKSNRRPRLSSSKSYIASDDGTTLMDELSLKQCTPRSADFSTLSAVSSPTVTTPTTATSIRNSLWSPSSSPPGRHFKQASFSSTASGHSDSGSSRKSSFDWDSLDIGVVSRIDLGHRAEHRVAAQTYAVSRQTRRMLRIQKHVNLQVDWI